MTKEVEMRTDHPISTHADDTLGRAESATLFADQVLDLDASKGLVVGVVGAWGSGKTSFINLARGQLANRAAAVVDFNPWMFSGAEQLVDTFFVEVSAQLKTDSRLRDVGESLGQYGEAFGGLVWIPVLGPWLERARGASRAVKKLAALRKEGIAGRRAALAQELAHLKAPIVVLIDDIDRLTTAEIRNIFRLVRLTASFPNIIYVLAFDRRRVELALDEDGVPGRDYLEKIMQVMVDLPSIPPFVLRQQLVDALNEALGEPPDAWSFSEQRWPDVLAEILAPLVSNVRDVRRYASSVRGTLAAIDGQIELVDVFALEAVRLFLPDVFAQMRIGIEVLTAIRGDGYGDTSTVERQRSFIEGLVASSGESREVVEALVSRIFPAAARHIGGMSYGGDWTNTWLRERRVAHEDILRLYFERAVPESLTALTRAEGAWALVGDEGRFDEYLRSLPEAEIEAAVAALEMFEDDFGVEHAVPGVTVLLNLRSDLPERDRGMFGISTRMVVTRVVYRLLRVIGDPVHTAEVVDETLTKLRSLSAKKDLIRMVGYRENAGHQLVDAETAERYERAWRDDVRAASAESLAAEQDLLYVLYAVTEEADPSEPPLAIPDDASVTARLLSSAVSVNRRQALGNRAVTKETVLAWDALTALFGSEEALTARVDDLADQGSAQVSVEILQLAQQYVEGWRPEEF